MDLTSVCQFQNPGTARMRMARSISSCMGCTHRPMLSSSFLTALLVLIPSWTTTSSSQRNRRKCFACLRGSLKGAERKGLWWRWTLGHICSGHFTKKEPEIASEPPVQPEKLVEEKKELSGKLPHPGRHHEVTAQLEPGSSAYMVK